MSTEQIDPVSPEVLPKVVSRPTVPIPPVLALQRIDRNQHRSKILPAVLFVSLAVHALILGVCALIVFKNPQLIEEIFTTVTDPESASDPISEQSMLQTDDLNSQQFSPESMISNETASQLQADVKGPIDLNVSDSIPQIESESSDLPGIAGIKIGEETSGRMSANVKRSMVQKFGGNSASEAAVASGMKWLTNHQLPNGSWSFEHSKHVDCKGQCSQDGSLKSCPTGATGLALLAFLGGGHTHKSGDYQREVKRGIDFLIKSGKSAGVGLDLRGKTVANEGMYVQGLCTIALCECAAMTKDSRVKKAAEGAIDFIVQAQLPEDGGWRYDRLQPGDTSVVGWQVMALKSGHDAKLKFAPQAFKNAESFLKRAGVDGGARYVYFPGSAEPGEGGALPTPTMTAVGLLCRMYMGWDHKNKKLAEGVAYLDTVKPDPNNLYFNYYATQVMHHWGGEEWKRWNEVMRDQLVRTQHPLKDGHMAGSWDIADPNGGVGGRLYMTCLSVMTLEVYYRHLPMYSRENIKVEF